MALSLYPPFTSTRRNSYHFPFCSQPSRPIPFRSILPHPFRRFPFFPVSFLFFSLESSTVCHFRTIQRRKVPFFGFPRLLVTSRLSLKIRRPFSPPLSHLLPRPLPPLRNSSIFSRCDSLYRLHFPSSDHAVFPPHWIPSPWVSS